MEKRYMLYEILSIILVIYACLSPFWVMKAIKFGAAMAKTPEKAVKEPIIQIPKKEKPKKDPVLSDQEQMYVDILSNVGIFDGTSAGQKEIKV